MDSIKISNDSEMMSDSNPMEIGTVIRPRLPVSIPDGLHEEALGSGFIQSIVGTGGMATVYRIWNRQLEVSRAVKLLHPNCNEETRQRFQTEMKITAKLHHANIIEIHAVGLWKDLPFIEMELIEGVTIDTLVKQRGALPVEVCTSIGIMIGRALRYAHNSDYVLYGNKYHGVIHRDLKPSNVMISESGVVKLMDFGIARPADASIHTTDGSILGTMQYLSPEQLAGTDLDVRTDIYSLGTVLYELITGAKVFPDQNVSRLMMSKMKNHFREIREFDVEVPLPLRQLVHNCLLHNRKHRICDATEFLSRITGIHRRITDRTPESILAEFMNAGRAGKRNTVALRKRNHAGLILLMAAVIIAVALIVNSADFKRMIEIKNRSGGKTAAESVVKTDASGNANKPLSVVDKKIDQTRSLKTETKINRKVMSADPHSGSGRHQTEKKLPAGEVKVSASVNYTELFIQQVQKGDFREALKTFESISPADINDRMSIFHIRALRGAGNRIELKNALFGRTINDAEVNLERGRYFYENNDIQKALTELKECGKKSAAYIENSQIRIEMLYLTARCKSRLFDDRPSASTQSEALDSWFEVKSELQTEKDDKYYKEADLEMQRITGRMSSTRG